MGGTFVFVFCLKFFVTSIVSLIVCTVVNGEERNWFCYRIFKVFCFQVLIQSVMLLVPLHMVIVM